MKNRLYVSLLCEHMSRTIAWKGRVHCARAPIQWKYFTWNKAFNYINNYKQASMGYRNRKAIKILFSII